MMMIPATDLLPITETVTPTDEAGVIEAIRRAAEAETAIYPIGGGTGLGFGLPARKPGIGLNTTGLDQVVDYPARDMTITIGAGVTVARLAGILAGEGQRLPVDAPQADQATLGGVVATNASGPRRYAFGTIRDYLIGVTAVDGLGRPFRGGGRVVKNVAGYDFCKLLTGSLGTLGVITQLTLKVRPLPEANLLLACDVADADQAEKLLAGLVTSATTPNAIELLIGPAWAEICGGFPDGQTLGSLVVGLEGTGVEVEWMRDELEREWREQGVGRLRVVADRDAERFWSQLVEFPADGDGPCVLKVSVPPSQAVRFASLVCRLDPQASIQIHAGSGVMVVRFSGVAPDEMAQMIVGQLRPAAIHTGGSAVVLSYADDQPTRQTIWGGRDAGVALMEKVRDAFDPRRLLNPGRFVY